MPAAPQTVPVNDPEETRARLLAVAMTCFDRHGLDKTVMEDIAKAAGVSRPTVYRYLGDRTNLLLTLVVQRSRVIIGETKVVIARQRHIEDKVVEGIVYAVGRAREDPYLGILVSPRHLELSNRLVVEDDVSVALNLELWLDVLTEAKEAGQLRPELDLHHVCQWLSQVEYVIVARTAQLPSTDDDLRTLIRTFVLPGLFPDDQRRRSRRVRRKTTRR